jgi:hypothetical protein
MASPFGRLDRVSNEENTHTPKHILVGLGERIFHVLPAGAIANMSMRGSESALLWNLIYPLARPTIALHDLMAIRPLWGTALSPDDYRDQLVPYFWGYGIDGDRLEGLDAVLGSVDGAGPRTEVDLLLRGAKHLVVVEAKNLAFPGRCSRFAAGRCPEVHRHETDDVRIGCRYWVEDGAQFDLVLDFGQKPVPGVEPPPCDRHYQLGRTLLVGTALASRLGLSLHMWMMVPMRSWPSVERNWLDFVGRVRDESVWRRLRVLPWKRIRALSHGRSVAG